MLGKAIEFLLLPNLPVLLFVVAIALALSTRGRDTFVERLLAWTLLLPVGVTGLWAGVSHVFFPATAAAHIGWQASPFQFEVGTADFAIGVAACVAFGRTSHSRPPPSARPLFSFLAMLSGTPER
jgi:4-amino-4-deoxy-L-arabinose transferase-like glycosyltransferase